MLKAAGLHGSVGQSAAVSLLDWYFLRKELILVMERPSQSMDLDKYLESRGGFLNEQEAKVRELDAEYFRMCVSLSAKKLCLSHFFTWCVKILLWKL